MQIFQGVFSSLGQKKPHCALPFWYHARSQLATSGSCSKLSLLKFSLKTSCILFSSLWRELHIGCTDSMKRNDNDVFVAQNVNFILFLSKLCLQCKAPLFSVSLGDVSCQESQRTQCSLFDNPQKYFSQSGNIPLLWAAVLCSSRRWLRCAS